MSAPTLSVVVIFFDMRREASRTLWSLTPAYQDVPADEYEVIAVDNGSPEPLDPRGEPAWAENFRLLRLDPGPPSPVAALNHAVGQARGLQVMILIDGARILSPGILGYALKAFRAFDDPFVYTLGMHIGDEVQNESMVRGYDQAVEDELLESIDWRTNGYELFKVSSLARSSRHGFFSTLSESNCVALRKDAFHRIGGYDERFRSRGGGLVNLDFFNRVHLDTSIDPVMLLGEATFHQFHGGVATNVPTKDHPWAEFASEYEAITGRPYETVSRPPHYLGRLHPDVDMGSADPRG